MASPERPKVVTKKTEVKAESVPATKLEAKETQFFLIEKVEGEIATNIEKSKIGKKPEKFDYSSNGNDLALVVTFSDGTSNEKNPLSMIGYFAREYNRKVLSVKKFNANFEVEFEEEKEEQPVEEAPPQKEFKILSESERVYDISKIEEGSVLESDDFIYKVTEKLKSGGVRVEKVDKTTNAYVETSIGKNLLEEYFTDNRLWIVIEKLAPKAEGEPESKTMEKTENKEKEWGAVKDIAEALSELDLSIQQVKQDPEYLLNSRVLKLSILPKVDTTLSNAETLYKNKKLDKDKLKWLAELIKTIKELKKGIEKNKEQDEDRVNAEIARYTTAEFNEKSKEFKDLFKNDIEEAELEALKKIYSPKQIEEIIVAQIPNFVKYVKDNTEAEEILKYITPITKITTGQFISKKIVEDYLNTHLIQPLIARVREASIEKDKELSKEEIIKKVEQGYLEILAEMAREEEKKKKIRARIEQLRKEIEEENAEVAKVNEPVDSILAKEGTIPEFVSEPAITTPPDFVLEPVKEQKQQTKISESAPEPIAKVETTSNVEEVLAQMTFEDVVSGFGMSWGSGVVWKESEKKEEIKRGQEQIMKIINYIHGNINPIDFLEDQGYTSDTIRNYREDEKTGESRAMESIGKIIKRWEHVLNRIEGVYRDGLLRK